jgi:crotonobetainyl-CoA:carnitine CoA-transferase CaiB-like acyl-CoA transferase
VTASRAPSARPRAFAGVRVLDAATNIAGPYAASILADFGADVVKVEPVAGDPMRAYPPSVGEHTTQWAAVNHDKRYLALDLRRPQGREILAELIRGADVLVQNMRPGREARLGLDAASCHDVNPRLVHATLSAFYPADGDRPGYDILVQGESGLLHLTGEPDRPPSRLGASVIDHVSGLWLALGVLAALAGPRERATVQVAMIDVAVALLNEKISAFLATGDEPRRMGAGTTATTPHGAFPTADGYIVIGAATDTTFRALAEALGPPVDGDQRFASQAGRLRHRDELEAAVAQVLRVRDTDHWIAVLEQAGVPVGRVATLKETMLRHERDSATGIRAVDGTGIRVVAPPLVIEDGGWGALSAPGGPGRDADAVLAELGFSPERVSGLRQAGVIR